MYTTFAFRSSSTSESLFSTSICRITFGQRERHLILNEMSRATGQSERAGLGFSRNCTLYASLYVTESTENSSTVWRKIWITMKIYANISIWVCTTMTVVKIGTVRHFVEDALLHQNSCNSKLTLIMTNCKTKSKSVGHDRRRIVPTVHPMNMFPAPHPELLLDWKIQLAPRPNSETNCIETGVVVPYSMRSTP